MIDKTLVENIVEELLGGKDLFLVEVKVSKDNCIEVFIDGDNGVKIHDCIDLSRGIEARFDRESEDFQLSVLSWGLGEELKLKRQYVKNIAQRVKVETCQADTIEGELKAVGENDLTIQRTIGKGKKATTEQLVVNFDDLKSIRVII